ncbi:MAG: hypothetical protein M3Z37_06870 [Candidatus Eremiobacteraeota bacterium]|nr:hypothetical protein [Candidatus Eremiobacteraeota bacterium]
MRLLLPLLCLVGAYAAVFMFRKQRRFESGAEVGDSVVIRPAAKLLGVSNALLGLGYYSGVLIASPWLHGRTVFVCVLVAAALAALMSAALAYSLLFVTRRACVLCWIGHTVNWLILLTLLVDPAKK